MANFKQVYMDAGNGEAVALNYAQCSQTGAKKAVAGGRRVPLSQVQAQGLPIVRSNANPSSMSPINITENQSGTLGLARREFQQGAGGVVRTYQISFTNSSGSQQTAYIGDGNTIAYQANGGSPLPGSVAIGGTWGANSLAIFKLVTSNTPIRVDKIRINFDNANYLANGSLVTYKTRPDAIEDTTNLNLTTWISPDQFQSLIVENPGQLRLVWDATLALAAGLPDGRTVTFTFFYVSVADVHDMRLVGSPAAGHGM